LGENVCTSTLAADNVHQEERETYSIAPPRGNKPRKVPPELGSAAGVAVYLPTPELATESNFTDASNVYALLDASHGPIMNKKALTEGELRDCYTYELLAKNLESLVVMIREAPAAVKVDDATKKKIEKFSRVALYVAGDFHSTIAEQQNCLYDNSTSSKFIPTCYSCREYRTQID
jgi:hypothetical protein